LLLANVFTRSHIRPYRLTDRPTGWLAGACTNACLQVTLTAKQMKDLHTRTKRSGEKLDIDRVMMEGFVTTTPEIPTEMPTVVNAVEFFSDRQNVTELVGGGRPSTAPNRKAPKLSAAEEQERVAQDAAAALKAVAALDPALAMADEARREKARRKKKLKRERQRMAKAAAAADAADAAAATGAPPGQDAEDPVPETPTPEGTVGAFEGVD